MALRNDNPKYSMTACAKTGIKIKYTDNEYTRDPFADVNPFQHIVQEPKTMRAQHSYETMDLVLAHYSREELYTLFGLKSSTVLTDEHMKEAKKIVLKTHPDKSRLDNKYFIFFSQAFLKLKDIYEFQNKIKDKRVDTCDYSNSENNQLLDKMFDKKNNIKDTTQFNQWFNDQFDKHRLEDPVGHGYGDWLKSDDGVVFTPQNISKDSMAREMEKRKKTVQSLTPYTGVGNAFHASSAGGSSLMEYNSNFTSGSLFSGNNGMGYTDLRQAYVESVIPVTEEDFHNVPQFANVNKYKQHRDSTIVAPLSKEEALRQLYQQDKQNDEESAALAFYYAQQSDKVQQQQDKFWSGLKQLTQR